MANRVFLQRCLLSSAEDGIAPRLGYMLASSFPSLLWHCSQARNLAVAKLSHALLLESERHPNGYLSNLLLQAYGKCGAFQDALSLFGLLEVRDVFSWSTMIESYTQHGDGLQAFRMFARMQLENAVPNKFAFLSILPSCHHGKSNGLFVDGKRIHVLILASGLELDAFLGTSLIHMYSDWESLECARHVFDHMMSYHRNVVAWTAIASATIRQDRCSQALQIFGQMLLESVFPDKILFVSIFEGCHCASEVKYMHVYTLNMGYDSDVIIKNALVNMYARFSNLSYARMTFQDMSQRTVVSWTTLISAYLQHGLAEEALQLFQQMFLECVLPDNVTFVNVLAACTKINALTEGKRMHSCVFCSDCKLDETVHNAILHLYGKCGSLKDAQKMFRSMVKRDLVSWNAMIAAYAHNGHLKGSFHLYRLMRDEDLVPDKVTFLCLIEGCTKHEALAEGIWVHNNMLDTGFGIDVVTATALIEMYGRCGNFDAASDIFEALQERDVIIWTAFIVACIHTERGKTALQNFQQLQMQAVMPNNVTFVNVILACANQADEQEGKHVHVRARACDLEETVVIGTALVDLYGKCGNVEEARKLFNILPERDSFSWNAMITAYAQHGDGECALQVFGHMQLEGLIPDEVTLSVILRAFSHTGFIDEAYQYLSLIIVRYNTKSLVDYCVRIVDLLSRAGQLSDAENLMNQMPYQPCGVLWATMLGACSLHLDVDRGEHAAAYALELTPTDIIPYVALSNLYAASGTVLDDIVI